MYTLEDFTKDWHNKHPQMNVEAEAAYYYDIYCKIAKLSRFGEEDGVYESWHIMDLMLYVENMGHLGLDKSWQDIYRFSEDAWLSLVESVEYDSWDDFRQALVIVEDAIKHAPKSGLVERMNEVVIDVDFQGLAQMLTWLMDNNEGLQEIIPQYYKERKFEELLPHSKKEFVEDLAKIDSIFCWKDKEGYTIAQRVADRMGALGYADARNNLMALCGNHVDAYRITDVKADGVVAIENIKRTVKGEVVLSESLPENYKDLYIVGITVQWDKLYLCEPYTWMPKLDIIRVDFEEFYHDMLESFKIQACAGDIQLCSGRKVSGKAELYGKGMAKVLGYNKYVNAWRLGVNNPGYSDDFLKQF